MTHLILSCSPRPDSHSRRLAHLSEERLRAAGQDAVIFDLRDRPLPAFDNASVFEDPAVQALHRAISDAAGVVICSPVYNWALASGLKTAIEATGAIGPQGLGAAWVDKLVSFVCAAGVHHSYMAFSATATSLMLDFNCIINPHAVFVTEAEWQGGDLVPDRAARLDRAIEMHCDLAQSLSTRRTRSEWGV